MPQMFQNDLKSNPISAFGGVFFETLPFLKVTYFFRNLQKNSPGSETRNQLHLTLQSDLRNVNVLPQNQ